jgi:hypothetical protein
MVEIVLPLLPIGLAAYCIWLMFRPEKDDSPGGRR